MSLYRRAADIVREAAICCLADVLKGAMRMRWLLLARCVYPAYSI